jgi:RNA polymerase-binding transcription factor DksA
MTAAAGPERGPAASGAERRLAGGPERRLAAARLAAQQRIAGLERDFRGIVESASAGSTDDEHDPEGATIAFERQHVAALLSQARDELGRIDAAMARLAAGVYGRCESCGRPIGAGRLAARPAATRCLRCAGAAQARTRRELG